MGGLLRCLEGDAFDGSMLPVPGLCGFWRKSPSCSNSRSHVDPFSTQSKLGHRGICSLKGHVDTSSASSSSHTQASAVLGANFRATVTHESAGGHGIGLFKLPLGANFRATVTRESAGADVFSDFKFSLEFATGAAQAFVEFGANRAVQPN